MDLWAGRDMRAAGYDELLPGEQAALEQRLRGEIRRNTWDAETATYMIQLMIQTGGDKGRDSWTICFN